MKINSSGLDHYKNYVQAVKTSDTAGSKGQEKAAGAHNTDKVMISQDAAGRAEASRLATTVAAEVESAASAERIETLRVAVENGTYSVPAAAVADAILDRLV